MIKNIKELYTLKLQHDYRRLYTSSINNKEINNANANILKIAFVRILFYHYIYFNLFNYLG